MRPRERGSRRQAQPEYRCIDVFVLTGSVLLKRSLFSAQIPGHMAAILLIRRAKGVHKVSFLLQYLQVEHDDGKDRKAERQQVSVQQQGTNIHEVKAEKRRVAAETVNTGRDKLRFILVGNTRLPAIFHAQDGQQEDRIAQYSVILAVSG